MAVNGLSVGVVLTHLPCRWYVSSGQCLCFLLVLLCILTSIEPRAWDTAGRVKSFGVVVERPLNGDGAYREETLWRQNVPFIGDINASSHFFLFNDFRKEC